MKTSMMSRLSVAVSIVSLGGRLWANEPRAKLECSGPQISEAVANGNFDHALAITQHCIETQKADLERLEKEYARKPSDYVDAVGLVEVTTGAFLVAKAEILALKGAFLEAESALADAEQFDQKHPQSAMSWSMSGAPLAVARAFLLEKKGDLSGATAAYKAILTEAVRNGWPGISTVTHGRLALIALLMGDDATAERWSKDALSGDPGANVAFAVVLQKRGDQKRAKEHYAAALKLMSDARKAKNWSLPVYFAEQKRAKDGADK